MPSAPNRTIWLDGRLVPWSEVTVHVLSHSMARGSLVFDYMSVHATPRGPASSKACAGRARVASKRCHAVSSQG
jgi:hypothetical protein